MKFKCVLLGCMLFLTNCMKASCSDWAQCGKLTLVTQASRVGQQFQVLAALLPNQSPANVLGGPWMTVQVLGPLLSSWEASMQFPKFRLVQLWLMWPLRG